MNTRTAAVAASIVVSAAVAGPAVVGAGFSRPAGLSAEGAARLCAARYGEADAAVRQTQLAADLDAIFDQPVLSRALVGIRVESLGDGATLYERNGARLVIPASNMKLVTMAVAAERLGWEYRYETRLEAAGVVENGALKGDLIVTGSGDPSIDSHDGAPAALFERWADAIARAGIRRVDGRLIGDDNAFDDESVGPGWAWDNLTAGYAAPTGALSYNENVIVVRVLPGPVAGEAARIELAPPAALFEIVDDIRTGAAGSAARVNLSRLPFTTRLVVQGTVPAGGSAVSQTTTVDNPTRFFVEGFRHVLAGRGIAISGGAWDIDDLDTPPPDGSRREIARRESLPLSYLGGRFMKSSQNFYGETFLKTIGRSAGGAGSTNAGRQAARETLVKWGIPADSVVISDGSGLSRYNYVSADAIVELLKHVWHDERLRGRFVALLPVGGHDGTLDSRMKGTSLARRVQAKTGTIANVRSLSGYLETKSGERLVFSMIANHFTAPSKEIDAVVEKALMRLVER